MDLDIHCSQLSLRSSSYQQPIPTDQYSSSLDLCRLKKFFCCHQMKFSSSCLNCFRYFIPKKHKRECHIQLFD